MISSFNNLSFLGIPKPFQLLPIFSLIIFFLSFTSSSLAQEEKKFQLQVYMTKKQAFEVAFPGADKVEKERINKHIAMLDKKLKNLMFNIDDFTKLTQDIHSKNSFPHGTIRQQNQDSTGKDGV